MNELRSFFPTVQKALLCEDYRYSSLLHTIVLTRDNEVRAYGHNDYGQLGVGDNKHRKESTPVLFATPLASKVIRVFAGDCTSAVITAEGALYIFGFGCSGQLGTGRRKDENRATLIPLPGRAVQVALGWFHTEILLEDGRLFTCGDNDRGQLEFGDKSDLLEPTEVPQEGLVVNVQPSNFRTAITLESGKLVKFGKDYFSFLSEIVN